MMNQQIPSSTAASTSNVEADNAGEHDNTALNDYLVQSCCTLLDVNKDKFYKALHESANQDILAQFSQEKNQRALLVSKIDLQRGKEEEENKDDV